MRYTICLEQKNKNPFITKNNAHGIYVHGKYVPYILNFDNENHESYDFDYIYVCEDIEIVKKLVKYLSDSYRRDDVWKFPQKKSAYIRNFYPVKIDSNNFPYIIKKEKWKTISIEIKKDNNYIETIKVDLHKIERKKE